MRTKMKAYSELEQTISCIKQLVNYSLFSMFHQCSSVNGLTVVEMGRERKSGQVAGILPAISLAISEYFSCKRS